MAIYDYLPTFHVVEPNNLKGLQPGFVVVQMEVKNGCSLLKNGLFENGHICCIGADGIDIWAAGKPMFIHFTEPLNTIVNSDKYFAVNTKEECPRLVQLIPGDEWTTDIKPTDTAYAAEITAGRIAEVKGAEGEYSRDNFLATKTLADGTEAHHYVFLG